MPLWNTTQVADYLGVSMSTVSSYRHRNQMPRPIMTLGQRTHLWDADEIRRWARSRTHPSRKRKDRVSHADSRIGPDGYQYGVMFCDGSVRAEWNGRTQRDRAAACLAEIRRRYPTDRFDLVRRDGLAAAWKIVPADSVS